MATPTTIPYSSTSRVTWVRCSAFLLACIFHMPTASSDQLFKTVVDYPKGCNQGPGPAEGDKIELLPLSCIFSLKGQKPDGVYQETGGIVIRTNKAGHWGEMMIQVNLVKNRTSGETEVNVKTSGWAHLWFDYAGIGFHYNPAPGNQHFSGTPVVRVSLASVVHVVYPDGKKAWSPWYGIDGFASSKHMELLAIPELHEDSKVPLQEPIK
ncbi:hypothetical protein FOL46_000987, partial [Perkinsus olseni]